MLDARELADIRADYADAFFTDTVLVQREQAVSDGGYSETTTWQTVATLKGRVVNARRDRRREEGETAINVSQVQIQLPWDVVVNSTDRLVVGGRSFNVVGTDSERSERLCLAVDVSGV